MTKSEIRSPRKFFLLHLKPTKVRTDVLRFSYTFGLGGTALVLFALMVASGALLVLVYEASPERAYSSIIRLGRDLRFGQFVRNIHHHSSHLLIAAALFHMARVFFTGAYHGKRRLNWVVGVIILYIVMAANFTGYLLPWDQLSYWAVTISTAMLGYIPWVGESLVLGLRGASDVGAPTLTIFYAFHTTLIPTALAILLGYHFFRVRRAKGVNPPVIPGSESDNVESVPAWPHLLLRELVVLLCVLAVVMTAAVFIDAPLGAPANPGMSPNPAKAPWYFVGFQELQIHLHPLFAVVIIPLLLALVLIGIPYLKVDHDISGAWFLTSKGRLTSLVAGAASLFLTVVLIVVDDTWFYPLAGQPSLFYRGVLPLCVLIGLTWGFGWVATRVLSLSRCETVQALCTGLLVSLMVLTGVGVWFRGANMALVWPLGTP